MVRLCVYIVAKRKVRLGFPSLTLRLTQAYPGCNRPIKHTVCLSCKGKSTLFLFVMVGDDAAAPQSQMAPPLLSICHGKMRIGNLITSFKFRKAVWLLCWNLYSKRLFLRHSGKGYIISTCEVQEDKGRSKSPRIMHWELRSYRCFSGNLWREFHWVHGCILSLKETKIKFYKHASSTMTSLNPE